MVEESKNVAFDELKPPWKVIDLVDDDKYLNEDNLNDVKNVIHQMGNLKLWNKIRSNHLELNETEVDPQEISLIKDRSIDNV